MAEIRGSLRRTILPPGYHVGPEYDLPGLRFRMSRGAKKSYNVILPLTSMIDMFSMLVIFLILNFSSTGEVFFINKNLSLPEAKNARPLQSLPLISVTDEGVTFDAEKVGDNPLHLEERDWELPQLKALLQRIKVLEETIRPGEPFVGRVNIQTDEATRVIYVKRVMNALVSEGWLEIHFATKPAADRAQ